MTEFDNSGTNEPNHYTDVVEIPSPLGSLRSCRHLESGDRRALKVLRSGLADEKLFYTWYMAAVSLAGQAAERLNQPSLIPPLRSPQRTWETVRNGEHIVERQYFTGTDDHPARNMNEFVEKYSHGAAGLEDDVAVAVMRLILETLVPMHSAKMASEQGVKLNGIPHLNLKPENIILGQDKRTLLMQVKLTDFLVPMAIPLVEQAGVSAPLNYSSDLILNDDSYYGLRADIFSCGLLLYKLVENKDLIPANLSRSSTVAFIKSELPGKLKNLKLTSARSRTRDLIVRCLTDNENEQFGSLADMHAEIERSMKGKDPATILTDFVNREKNYVPPPPPKPINWKPIIIGAGAVVALAVIIFVWMWAVENAARKTIETNNSDIRSMLRDFNNVSCVQWGFSDHFETRADSAWSHYMAERFDDAKALQSGILDTLKMTRDYCARYQTLRQRTLEVLAMPLDTLVDSSIAMAERDRLATKLDMAAESATERQFAGAQRYLTEVEDILAGFGPGDGSAWMCDGGRDIDNLQSQADRLKEACREEADRIIRDAELACEDNDSISYFEARSSLEVLLADARCGEEDLRPTPTNETPPPKVEPFIACEAELHGLELSLSTLRNTNCYDDARNVYQQAVDACSRHDSIAYYGYSRRLDELSESSECAEFEECTEARQFVKEATVKESSLRQLFDSFGLPENNCLSGDQNYVSGFNDLQKARMHLDSGACKQAIFRAKSSSASFDQMQKDLPYIKSTIMHYKQNSICVNKSTELASMYSSWLVQAEQHLVSCNYSYAEAVLIELDTAIERVFGSIGECLEAPAAPVYYTAEECWQKFSSGSPEAVDICLQCDPEDPKFEAAMKWSVLAAGNFGRFERDLRGRLQRAFMHSRVDRSLEKENAQAYITMACVYGWDTLGISMLDLDSAYHYYEIARGFGPAMEDVKFWWKGWLVAVRRHYERWQINPTPSNYRKAKDEAQDLRNYMIDHNVAGTEPYQNELRNYITEMTAKARGGR